MTTIQFSENFMIRINSKIIYRKSSNEKNSMEKTQKKNCHIHMFKDKVLFSILTNLYLKTWRLWTKKGRMQRKDSRLNILFKMSIPSETKNGMLRRKKSCIVKFTTAGFNNWRQNSSILLIIRTTKSIELKNFLIREQWVRLGTSYIRKQRTQLSQARLNPRALATKFELKLSYNLIIL